MPGMSEDRIADRSRAIEAALLNIEKRFGKGSIMRLGERDVSDIPAISTTSLSLDAAIGVGGVARYSNDFLGGAFTQHGNQCHIAVLIDIHQACDELRGGLTQCVHETLEARLGREAHDERALTFRIVAVNRPNAVFDSALHAGGARPGLLW